MNKIRALVAAGSRRILDFKEIGVLTPLVAFALFVGITHPVFFSLANLVSMIREAAFVGITAFGMTFVLIGAGIGFIILFYNIEGYRVTSKMRWFGFPIPVAIWVWETDRWTDFVHSTAVSLLIVVVDVFACGALSLPP